MPLQTEPADRVEPPLVADERTMLDGWLDYHRRTLLWKCEELSDDQLKTAACPPSNLTLLGLVRHMTEVERGWFRQELDGQEVADPYCTEAEPEADIENLDDTDVATVFQRFRDELDACRAVTARYDLVRPTCQTVVESEVNHSLTTRWGQRTIVPRRGAADTLVNAVMTAAD